MAIIHVSLLGRLRLTQGDTQTDSFRTRKTALLLAHLTYFSHRQHSREEFADLYWPELPADSARHNLRQTISTLRRYVEPEPSHRGVVLRSNHTYLQLDPAFVHSDVAAFVTLLNQVRTESSSSERLVLLERATALYVGELLPGFYDEWILAERQHLSVAYVQALQWLWEHHHSNGDTFQALEHALRAAQYDPYNETAHHAVMTFFQASRQPERAMAHYEAFAQRIRDELSNTPSSALQALADHIGRELSSSPPSASYFPSSRSETTASRRNRGFDLFAPDDHSDPLNATNAQTLRTAPTSSLPLSLTAFFGREQELQRIVLLLKVVRLLTLTGLGGSGKTRLALEAGRSMEVAFAGTVCFVPLADVLDAEGILPAVLDALHTASAPENERPVCSNPLTQVKEFLKRQPTLLILDNFEHLAAEGGALIGALLEQCANLACLITSRLPLGLANEQIFALRSLEAPATTQSLAGLVSNPAVQLFVNRVQARQSDFRLTSQNAGTVAQLCADLEGLPLALELAAARIGTFTPAQMRGQLAGGDGRFRLLVSRHRDRGHRHHSLQTALDGSFLLLPADQQRFFACLSALHGAWTAEAAQALCAGIDAEEVLEALCLCSLVIPITSEENERYCDAAQTFSILETLRQYGRQRLSDAEAHDAAQHHALYFLRRAEDGTAREPVDRDLWYARTHNEEANMLAALEWCFGSEGDERIGVRLSVALSPYWRWRGLFTTAWRYLERSMAAPSLEENALMKANVLQAASSFAGLLYNPISPTLGRECVALRRTQNDPLALAQALHNLGHDCWLQADFASAEKHHLEALALRREHGDTAGMAHSYNCLGSVAWTRGAPAPAQQYWAQNLTLSHAAQDESGVAAALLNLALIALDAEEWDRAQALSEEALMIYTQKNDMHCMGRAYGLVARATGFAGRISLSDMHFSAALSIMETIGDVGSVAGAILQQACVARHRGDVEATRRLLRQSVQLIIPIANVSILTWIHEFGLLACKTDDLYIAVQMHAHVEQAVTARCRLHPSEQKRQDACLTHARNHLAEADYARAWSHGQAMLWQEAIGLALTV